MNQKTKEKVLNYVVAVITIFLIIIIGVFVVNQAVQLRKQCTDLGFDTITLHEEKCVKFLDYNKLKGEYNRCYMSLEYNMSADVWCAE